MSNQLEDLLKEVQALRTEVKELKENKPMSKHETPWYGMTKYIDQQLDENISKDSYLQCKLKTAITSLVGKSFRKNNVTALDEEQCEKAKTFIDFIITFMKENRDETYKEDAPSGYERKPIYKI